MEALHFPPAGGTMTDHVATKDCTCSPIPHKIYKQAVSGRGGSHQGHQLVRIVYHHINEEGTP